MNAFRIEAPFAPQGDQPAAIETLCQGLAAGRRFQTLEGVTGSGKTFTVANVIARWGRPTLVISHNKTLAAQLYAELKSFFPDNAVEYFVSYYDYYQPEAYIPRTDPFIEKDASINEEIERLRLAATASLLMRDDVIVVASVSCIYGLGSPSDYREMVIELRPGQTIERDELLRRLVDIQYTRNDYESASGTFRVRGDTVDVVPSYARSGLRLNFMGDTIERARAFDPATGRAGEALERIVIAPASHFVMPQSRITDALGAIRSELEARVREFESQGKLLEAQRVRMRTTYDLEMMKELGYCSGIENYSRHLSGRPPGSPPATLMDYFPRGFLTIVDESHVTLPQIRGMYNGDQARKSVLVEHGFRLPSAKDNRPLRFDEFLSATGPMLFTSATPAEFERQLSGPTVPQLIRPTGLADPPVVVRPLEGQVDDLIEEVRAHAERGERVLVTTLTKRTAEDLCAYMERLKLRVRYLHSDIGAIERVEILRSLRKGDFDCLIGINLLREGLDLPEVALVAVLDADKEGFLRSDTSLIQTAGRAARHLSGKVILYAEHVTDSMRRMIEVTQARREKQLAYNIEHKITPRSVLRSIQDGLAIERVGREAETLVVRESGRDLDVDEAVREMEAEMVAAAEALEFERAALLRDQIRELKGAPAAPPSAAARGGKRKPTVYPMSGKRRGGRA